MLGPTKETAPLRGVLRPWVVMGLLVVLSLSACATCKSTDSPDICRTKQREHSQPRI